MPDRRDPFPPPDDTARAEAQRLMRAATSASLGVLHPVTRTPYVTRIAIGLDPFGTPDPLDEPAIAIAEAATTVLLDECFSDLNQARQAVLDALDGLGAADWTVRVEGATDAARPCAMAASRVARSLAVVVLLSPRS